jgi:hypothetical protein
MLAVSQPEIFLDGRVTLWCGDCLDVLARLDECSVDSVVCDPPYHLTSIVKRFGKTSEQDSTQTSERARGRVEGMRAVLIEREAEYQSDIRRRMEYALGGPEERSRAIVKAKGELQPAESLPLFGGAA